MDIGELNTKEHALLSALDAYQEYISDWARAKGFWTLSEELQRVRDGQASLESKQALERLVKSQKLMLVVSELGECLEGLRKPYDSDKIPGFSNEVEELADVVIRILDYAGHFNMPLAEAIIAKMRVNEGRPYRHGKNF